LPRHLVSLLGPPSVLYRGFLRERQGSRTERKGVAMPNRAGDWFNQAERDLEHAEASRRDGRHEWACFASHQAAEKALKALHLHNSQEAWGHVVARLLRELPVPYEEGLEDKGKVLDAFYIPTRYPNGHPEGAPHEHYGDLQSREAIRYAREIIEFVRAQMA
jgi:HEPN domain-containing protein